MLYISFGIGFALGMLTLAVLIAWMAHSAEKQMRSNTKDDKIVGELSASADQILEEIKKIRSVHEMFNEIKTISDEQAQIMAALERPNASASHSKHKKSLIMRMRDLEEKKLNLFDGILKNGIDPIVVSINEQGEQEEMPMSEVVKVRRADLEHFDQDGKTESKNPRGNITHLTLVKDEEFDDDDGKDTEGNPTLH